MNGINLAQAWIKAIAAAASGHGCARIRPALIEGSDAILWVVEVRAHSRAGIS